MDEGCFKKFGVANEKEIKEKITENIKSRKKAELQSEYRMQVGSQLTGLYDDFVLPEELIKLGNIKKIKSNEFKKYGSARKLYNFKIDNVSDY